MNWIQGIFYALMTGFTGFLPVSSQGHGIVVQYIFGTEYVEPLLTLCIRLGALAGLLFATRDHISVLRTERKLSKRTTKRHKRMVNSRNLLELSLVRTASIPLLLSFIFYLPAVNWSASVPLCALFLLLNGVILHLPAYMPKGIKDVEAMTPLDSFLIGLSSCVGIFSGFSRIGVTATVASMRGAHLQQAFKWSLLLSIPAWLLMALFDLFLLFGGSGSFGFLLLVKSLISAGFSFVGAVLSISLMRSLVQKGEFTGFSYYCWGAALFTFILYLI